MPKPKKPITTKRGQFHKHRKFWFMLVSDVSLMKMDNITIKRNQEKLEKKQIEVEKRNEDPENLQSTLREHFPLLVGKEISLWMMRKDNPNLVVLPAHVNSGAALCRYEELGRSCIYVKPQARPSDCDLMGAGSSSSTSGAVDIKVENRRAESPSIDSPAGGDEENQSDDGMVIQEEVDVEDISSAATTHLDAPLESPWVAIEEKLYMDLSHSTPGTQQMFYKPPNLQNQVQNQLQFHPQLQSDGPHDLSISTRMMDSHSSQSQHLDENVQPLSFMQLLNLNKRKFDSMESNTVHDKIIKFCDDPNDPMNPHATFLRNEIPNPSSFRDQQLTYVPPLNTYVWNTNENLFLPPPHLFPSQSRQMLDPPFYLNTISNPSLLPTTTNPFLPPKLNFVREDRLQSHREIKVEHEIRGITVMESKIYVICSDVTDLVFVYDVLTSEPSQIKVARMKSPVGIVACCVCRCLYITDDISKCVFRVTLANNKVDKFLDVIPSNLCVVHNKQSSGNGCLLLINDSIELYNTDSECVNVTVMESTYSPMLNKNIKQVCVDSKGNFIVSNESEIFSMILKLAKDGKTFLKTFGGRCGHGKGQLWKSFKILVDSRLEQILIFDRGNDRLLLVDSELCLIGERQIRFGEHRISFDELDQIGYCSDDNKIVIGGHGRLLIFDFAQDDFLQDANKCVNQSESRSEDSKNKEVTNSMDLQLLTSIVLENVKVRGTAILNDKIYVCFVDGKETKFKIYSREQPYNCLYIFEKTEVVNPSCLSACRVNVCLYLTDKNRDNPCVWKMTVNRKLTKWLEHVDPPFTLSVASDGSVVMLSVKEESRKLNIYDSFGNVSRCICLEDTMSGIFQHAVASANGCFYIAAAVLILNFDKCDRELKFYKVTSSGHHMYEENITVDKLLLTIDQDDNMYVVDSFKCQLLQLDRTLKSRKILLNSDVHLIENPVDIQVYDDKSGQLFLMTESSNNKETSYVELFSRNRIVDDKQPCPAGGLDVHLLGFHKMDGTNEEIKSLTWWNGRIYAAVKSNSKMRISVFSDEKSFEIQYNIDLPSDSKCDSLIVSASSVSECDALFVLETCHWYCDASCKCTKRIYKIEMIGNRIQIIPYAVVDSGNPCHMTVTNKLLIVLVKGKEKGSQDGHIWHLEIYSFFSTSRLRTINLPTEIHEAYGVVESSSGHLIIPYQGYERNMNSVESEHATEKEYFIFVVTYDGEIIQCLCLTNIFPQIHDYCIIDFAITCAVDIFILFFADEMVFIDIKLNNFKCLNRLHFYEKVSSIYYVRYGHRLIFGQVRSGFGVLSLNPQELAMDTANRKEKCNIEEVIIFSQCSDFFDKLNIDIRETLCVNKMTLSKNYIYMNCFDDYEPDDIHGIYIFSNKKPFKKMRELEMREVTCESLALASSSKSDVLFILECCSRECSENCSHAKRIFLVPYFGDQPHEWTRVVSGHPLDLSAESTQERLLVTVRDKDTATNYSKWYVYAYNMWTQGNQPERIELPEEINHVSKVKELSNGYLAVVYERSDLEYSNKSQGFDKNKYYFISHVTWNGDIVCRYPLPSHCSHLGIINNNRVVFDIENDDCSDIIVFDYETNGCQYIMQNFEWNINSLCYVEQKQLLMVGHGSGFSLVTLEEKCLKNISALPGPNQLKECGISRLQQSSFDQLSPRFGVRLLHDAVLRKVKNISSMAWVNNRIVAVQEEVVLFFSDKVPFRQYKSETSYYFCRTIFIAASNCGQALFVCCNRNIEKIEFPNIRKSTWNDCLKQKWEVLSLSCNADNLVALVRRCGAHDDSDNFLKDSYFGLVVYNPVAENWCTPNKIELPKSLNEPIESIESSNGHFIIACEIHRTTLKESSSKLDDDTRSYDENCWAYEVSSEGNVTRKFMCFDDSFDWHVYSCWLYGYKKYGLLLEEDNRIFLLDHKNNRLIISNSGNDCEVMSTHEIGKPTNMCYMRQKQQLIVARKTESDVAVSIYNLLWN